MIEFSRDVCGNLDVALKREWLETNGLGGFASSTIVGLNTRRYHSLLTAAAGSTGETLASARSGEVTMNPFADTLGVLSRIGLLPDATPPQRQARHLPLRLPRGGEREGNRLVCQWHEAEFDCGQGACLKGLVR